MGRIIYRDVVTDGDRMQSRGATLSRDKIVKGVNGSLIETLRELHGKSGVEIHVAITVKKKGG